MARLGKRYPTRRGRRWAILLLILAGCGSSGLDRSADPPAAGADPVLAEAQATVLKATAPATRWDGPTSGPKAQPGKTVIYVAGDFQNGGISGVADGAKEAAAAIGWDIQFIDAKGIGSEVTAAMEQAIALKPDAIIAGGFDAISQRATIQKAVDSGIMVVGWHVGPKVGRIQDPPVFANITSEPQDTARVTADYVIATSAGQAQVIILTDSQAEIAVAKAKAMQSRIEQCAGCKVLSYEDVSLAAVATRMGPLTMDLRQRFATTMTWMLGINDLYFDFAAPALQKAGVGPLGPPLFVSAGDGSTPAYERIRAGTYQVATIPEPLNLHGWMCIDELNRAFAGTPPSGYNTPVHIVTRENIHLDGGPQNIFDPDNDYRGHYQAIWGVQ
jgi:ribose transport system substrate-binding protein